MVWDPSGSSIKTNMVSRKIEGESHGTFYMVRDFGGRGRFMGV